ncbi:hypothetical protein ACN47E_000339 [Coniothyrium glycines]
MWFLEHESLFGGKRVWLRPGAQQLFGRTKSGDQSAEGKTWAIDNKAVSRKHVMLRVLEPKAEDGTKLHSRSQIEVVDLSCRQGTTIDEKDVLKSEKMSNNEIKQAKAVLSGTQHTIRLAQGYPPFKLVWQPYVFTYASKESREGKTRSAQLHALDIKTSSEFQFDKTTHVVSAKRNLPKVLSGLTSGKHIVTTAFLDAIINVAATSIDEEQNYTPSKLEEDFDAWWPKEKNYIPDVGAEPVPQPHEKLSPDPTRSEIFSGLTFIFLNEGQFSSLLEPINGGGGKALLFDVQPGQTTVQEYVDYVHNVAGKKRRVKSSNDMLPVITVRLPTYPDDMEAWATNFVPGVDQALNQRSILQNEFLDVIVTKDRASLQRPPTEAVSNSSVVPIVETLSMRNSTPMSQPPALQLAAQESPPVEEPVKIIPRKRAHRPKITSRFTGFDDYEPPVKKNKLDSNQMEEVQPPVQQPDGIGDQSQLGVAPATQTQAHFHDSVEKEEQMDSLFPAAASIRRQRAATRAPSASVEPEPVQPSKPKGAEALERLQRAKAKADKDINVREHTRMRIKEEEDRRKADEESLREALQGIDIAEMKNLAPIEEMDVLPPRQRTTSRNDSQAPGERWNPEWNGRRNFKKFRRRGAEHGIQAHRVIVALEEAPQKRGFGADAFFLEAVEPSSRARDKEKTRVGDDDDDDSSEPEPGFTRRKRTAQNEVVNVQDSGSDDGQGPQQRSQRSSGRTQRVVETQVEDPTQTQRGKKRGSSGTAAGQPATKRGKVSRRDEDSDDEETGFRFKRRG